VVYCGHGTGEAYFRGDHIERVPRCAAALLFGCSSGHLAEQGALDPDGHVLSYLVGGSPAVAANLWDVTDHDLDRMSAALMAGVGLLAEPLPAALAPYAPLASLPPRPTIAEALVRARGACRMPYLVGAAMVVYGIPVLAAAAEDD